MVHRRGLALLAVLLAACAGDEEGGSETVPPPGDGDGDGSGDGDGDGDGDGTGDGDGDGGGDGDGDGDGDGSSVKWDIGVTDAADDCEYSCSADLKHVLCDGQIVEDCDVDEACYNATCIGDPCLAAEAAQSSVGCDYWSVKTDLIAEGQGACFAAFVANTWDAPVHIELEYDGVELDATSFVKIPQGQGQALIYGDYDGDAGLGVGEVAIVFLAQQAGGIFMPACPSPAAMQVETAVAGTGRGSAFNIRTDRPIAAYQMLPFGSGDAAATSATLLLPTSAWDSNYIAVNAYEKSIAVPTAFPSMTIVAEADDTEISLLPGVDVIAGPGVDGTTAGVSVDYLLQRGETLQISQTEELTGSPIEANKRFGVFGAASCLNVPADAYACDSAHQQIPPITALGHEYAAIRYRNRALAVGEETPPWRLVGVVDDTELTWIPQKPAGAPDVIHLGEVHTFDGEGQWIVHSQDEEHPFYAASYMTGGGDFGGEGDPEWVNLVPTAQYLDRYVLFTDPTYSETSLLVVRKQGANGFEPVELACKGELGDWTTLGDYEYTRVDLVTGNFEPVDGCENGRQELWSDAPFGVTVWGWGSSASLTVNTSYVSYAYPAGASVQSINDVVVPAG